jgi:hypothetical protein
MTDHLSILQSTVFAADNVFYLLVRSDGSVQSPTFHESDSKLNVLAIKWLGVALSAGLRFNVFKLKQ